MTAVDRWPGPVLLLVLATLVVGVVALDVFTGGQVGVSFLYLIPVALASWRWGAPAGGLWALTAALAWALVQQRLGSDAEGVVVWNAVSRFVVFGAVALSVAFLRRERETVHALVGTDRLTSVQTARAFRDLIELERSRALRYNRPFTLAYMDVDGFRVVNEEWGHTAGDQALRLVADTIRENIRRMDSVSRMGGDEFALLFPETGKGAAEIALKKIQGRLGEAVGERSLPLTFTIGGVICVGAPESVDELIHSAESLMYEAKKEGGGGIRTEVLDENFGIEAILQRS